MWHRRPRQCPDVVRRVGLGLPGPAVFSVFGRLKPTLHVAQAPSLVQDAHKSLSIGPTGTAEGGCATLGRSEGSARQPPRNLTASRSGWFRVQATNPVSEAWPVKQIYLSTAHLAWNLAHWGACAV